MITSEQPEGIAIKQSPGEYAVRVLLDDKISAASLKVDSPYKIINVDTAEVFSAQKTDGTINIELANDGIKIGEQLFKTKRPHNRTAEQSAVYNQQPVLQRQS